MNGEHGRGSKGKRVIGENGSKGDGRGNSRGNSRGGRTLSIPFNNWLSKDQLISLLLNMLSQHRILEKIPGIKEWSRNTFFQHIRIDLDYPGYLRRIPSINYYSRRKGEGAVILFGRGGNLVFIFVYLRDIFPV